MITGENKISPLLLRVWQTDKASKRLIEKSKTVGHALVANSGREPTALADKWTRIYLYDPNNPYGGFIGKSNQSASWYLQAENRYIDIITSDNINIINSSGISIFNRVDGRTIQRDNSVEVIVYEGSGISSSMETMFIPTDTYTFQVSGESTVSIFGDDNMIIAVSDGESEYNIDILENKINFLSKQADNNARFTMQNWTSEKAEYGVITLSGQLNNNEYIEFSLNDNNIFKTGTNVVNTDFDIRVNGKHLDSKRNIRNFDISELDKTDIFEFALENGVGEGIDHSKQNDVILTGRIGGERNDGFTINLTNETLTTASNYSVRAYGTDGGNTWKDVKSNVLSDSEFPRLLNKGLELQLSDKPVEKGTKQPADGAIMVIFEKINARPKAPRLSINYETGADNTGLTAGEWVLTERRGTTAVKSGIETATTDDGKTPDGRGYGVFFEGETRGIAVEKLTGERTTYLIRYAPTSDTPARRERRSIKQTRAKS